MQSYFYNILTQLKKYKTNYTVNDKLSKKNYLSPISPSAKPV